MSMSLILFVFSFLFLSLSCMDWIEIFRFYLVTILGSLSFHYVFIYDQSDLNLIPSNNKTNKKTNNNN